MKYKDGLMNKDEGEKFCLVCTPRSGSYYVHTYFGKERGLTSGKEWYGRGKKVHYDGLETSSLTINFMENEDLLTNHEINKRRVWLKTQENFIIKCMPWQLSNTVENVGISIEERMDIAVDILSDYKLLWLKNEDKISQFCFRFIAETTSAPDYKGVNREYSDYNKSKRKTPPPNSFTATKEEFDKFMRQIKFVNDLHDLMPTIYEEIVFEDFIKIAEAKKEWCLNTYKSSGLNMKTARKICKSQNFWGPDIIHNPDYTNIFTNYQEILEWFDE